MAALKGSQTEKNLLTAFAGESQARNRYTFFSSIAKKEGYVLVSDLFAETAAQEKEHAERMFKHLEGGMLEIAASYPAGVLGTTLEKDGAKVATVEHLMSALAALGIDNERAPTRNARAGEPIDSRSCQAMPGEPAATSIGLAGAGDGIDENPWIAAQIDDPPSNARGSASYAHSGGAAGTSIPAQSVPSPEAGRRPSIGIGCSWSTINWASSSSMSPRRYASLTLTVECSSARSCSSVGSASQ